jgi:hypothetical protein
VGKGGLRGGTRAPTSGALECGPPGSSARESAQFPTTVKEALAMFVTSPASLLSLEHKQCMADWTSRHLQGTDFSALWPSHGRILDRRSRPATSMASHAAVHLRVSLCHHWRCADISGPRCGLAISRVCQRRISALPHAGRAGLLPTSDPCGLGCSCPDCTCGTTSAGSPWHCSPRESGARYGPPPAAPRLAALIGHNYSSPRQSFRGLCHSR